VKPRCLIYVRVSSKKQAGSDKSSLDEQEKACRKFADSKGWQVVEVVREAYSAKNKTSRPGLDQAREFARAGGADIILLDVVDRLLRPDETIADGMHLTDQIRREDKTDLEFARGLQTDDPLLNSLLEALQLYRAGADNRDRARRVKLGRLASVKSAAEQQNAFPFRLKYGYTKLADKSVAIHEGEAETIKQIFAWYVDQVPVLEIRRRLVADKIPTRHRSKGWAPSTLGSILSRAEEYSTGKVMRELYGQEFEFQLPPIINKQTARKAITLRKQNAKDHARKAKHVRRDYLLVGLVKCDCGRKWQARSPRRGTGEGTYRCTMTYHEPENVHKHCPGTWNAPKLDALVWDMVHDALLSEDPLYEWIQFPRAGKTKKALSAQIQKVQKSLAKYPGQRERVLDDRREDLITKDEFKEQVNKIASAHASDENRLTEYQAQLDLTNGEATVVFKAQELLNELRKSAGDAREFELKRELVLRIVDHVHVHEGEIDVYLSLQGVGEVKLSGGVV